MFANRTGAFQLKKRSILFRGGAVLLGLMPFLLFELTLHCIGWQQPDSIEDPYVGFTEIRPLFQVNESGNRYEIAHNRFPLFCPDSFPVEKPADEFRIFCVGGSTVQGRPFAIETAFSTWLELRLQVAVPTVQWNVINCGGVSYATYRLAPIMDEIVAYQPDLIVLYTGHNEFLEDRTYQSVKRTPGWAARVHERLSAVKTYSFVRSLFLRGSPEKPKSEESNALPAEVEARLDYRSGLELYHRDERWKHEVVKQFEHHLRRMLSTASNANVPLILCNPACNLRDASPFKSQHRSNFSQNDKEQFDSLWRTVINMSSEESNLGHKLDLLNQLELLDPRYAELQYFIGQTYQQLGDFDQANQHLIRAKEEDVCPLRIIEPMYDVISKVASESGVPVVDVKSCFEERAADGIPGRESMLDHVHPTIHGHQIISGLLWSEMAKQGLVKSTADESQQTELFESHLQSLPHLYFELGKDRLAGLKRWAEGRVSKEKPE